MNVRNRVRNLCKLAVFAQTYCANWNPSENSCIFRTGCRIAEGKSCEYFKKYVWPICDPAYVFATETCQYETLLGQYQAIDKNLVVSDKDESPRLCACGVPLQPRRRYCDKCQLRHRKQTYRQARKKTGSSATVNRKTPPFSTSKTSISGGAFKGRQNRSDRAKSRT